MLKTLALKKSSKSLFSESRIGTGVWRWWALQDLNLGPMDYESTALTAELRARHFQFNILPSPLLWKSSDCVSIVGFISESGRDILRAASCKSDGATIAYRSNTARVLCPVICIATRSGMPRRIIFLTAVRRRS